MKRKSLVQNNHNRHLVSPEPGNGQHSTIGTQQSGWARPVPGGNGEQNLSPSSLTTTAHGAQNLRE